MFTFESDELKMLEAADEDAALEKFAELYLVDAMRIIATRFVTKEDADLLYDAVLLTTSFYLKKLKNGEVHKNRMLH